MIAARGQRAWDSTRQAVRARPSLLIAYQLLLCFTCDSLAPGAPTSFLTFLYLFTLKSLSYMKILNVFTKHIKTTLVDCQDSQIKVGCVMWKSFWDTLSVQLLLELMKVATKILLEWRLRLIWRRQRRRRRNDCLLSRRALPSELWLQFTIRAEFLFNFCWINGHKSLHLPLISLMNPQYMEEFNAFLLFLLTIVWKNSISFPN